MSTPPAILLKGGTVLFHDSLFYDKHIDMVKPLFGTDVLIEGELITGIGPNLTAPSGADVIDCTDKIISPGFVDTHHHLWQTALKGRNADATFIDYMVSTNSQSYNYTPEEFFYGQLAGCLEAIDVGTTTVLDHNNGCYTEQHAEQALSATRASGIRAIFALGPSPVRFSHWDTRSCEPDWEVLPNWTLPFLEKTCREHPFDNRVHMGLGYDLFFLPKDIMISVYEQSRKAGVKCITTHAVRGFPLVKQLDENGLLGKDIVLSHGTDLSDKDRKVLWDKDVYLSTTPGTESQMGMGWPLTFRSDVRTSLGVDCHSNNSSSILEQARTALLMARQETAQSVLAQGLDMANLRGSSLQAFNLATIEGARALGMADKIGSISGGKFADLVVFSTRQNSSMLGSVQHDPLVAVLRHSDVRDIDMVLVGGKFRKRNGRLTDVEIGSNMVDWSTIVQRFLECSKKLEAKMKNCNLEIAKDKLFEMWHLDKAKFVAV
ncbi:hypothetical protein MMC13_006092 [Lambiella insularis]|nr:hypothetical protein [Lambiella insularis]